MSEIEKMYENAGVEYEERYNNCTLNKEGDCELKCGCDICKYSEEKYIYPPFTAEKQLSLIAFLINRKVELSFKAEQGEITVEAISRGLAGIVNRIWQSLTAEEKQQVKGILE